MSPKGVPANNLTPTISTQSTSVTMSQISSTPKRSKNKLNQPSPKSKNLKQNPLSKALNGRKEKNNSVKDFVKGTKHYATQKTSAAVHGKVSEAERDNAGIEAAHKIERVAERATGKLIHGAVNQHRKNKAEKKLEKADIQKLEKLYGTGHKTKDLVQMAYGKNTTISSLPDMPKSQRLKGLATTQMSGATLGRLVLEKKGHTIVGNTLQKGKKGLQFGTGKVGQKLQQKFDEAGQDNAGIKAAHEMAQLTAKPTKYMLKRGAKTTVDAVAKSPVGRAYDRVKQSWRRMWANQQRRFLMKHKGIAQARGIAAKAKAIIRELLTKARPVIATIGGLIIAFSLFQAIVTPAIAIFKAGAETVLMTTYPVENKDITDSTSQWKDHEVALEQRIEKIEEEFPDFDEYEYDIDPMVHDPFELMAYLSAMHLDFTHPEVTTEIAELFAEQNNLELIPREEIRYRPVTDAEGNTTEEEYIWRILLVRLKPKPFTEVAAPRLSGADAMEMYDLYMDSGGNRQAFGNPFAGDWRSRVSSYYGQRKNPTGPGYEFHTGIDIPYPQGTPIFSIQNGTVVVAGTHSLYGKYIVVRDADNNSSLYAHCNSLDVGMGDTIRKGQQIATVGTTGNSTGNHLHLEIKIKGERVNPLFYIGYGGEEEYPEG